MTMDPAPAATPDSPEPLPKDVRTMGMLCHLLALCGLVIPLGNILGPLVIWLVKKEEHPFIDQEGKASLNFQITVAIPGLVLAVLSVIPFVFCVTIPLLMALGVAALVFTIIGAIKANDGIAYKYPWSLELVK